MFKVKKKDTRTMSTSNDVFLVNCEHVSYLLSSAYDIDFKQVIFLDVFILLVKILPAE